MKKFIAGGCFGFCRIVVLLLLLAAFAAESARAQFTLDREPPGPSTRKTGLVITEILYNPRPVPGVATNLTHEFIELFNSKPWDEDISGFSIGGDVRYVFPSNTILRAGAYLVVARVPGLIVTNYAVTNVFGPWDGAATNRLSTERGQVRLLHRLGAVLLEVNYMDSPPWPEAADGTGHSLSLVRPSYGEDNFRAWAESDSVSGSPGGPDPVTPDPMASIFINEWQNHSDPVDWIELYNHSNDPVDLSGAWLSDTPLSNRFRIPNGVTIPARGFVSYDQFQLGFELFAGGETIFLWNSNQTRVIDVIDFRGQFGNMTSGRSPDGGPFTYGLASPTRNGPNSAPQRYPVVINEIMFNPISGSDDDEYLEIYNRSTGPVDLSGWECIVGISFNFPTNATTINMPAGAHWVLAKNPTNLFAIYSNLNTNNTFGPYGGALANGGERVVLAADDYDRVAGPGGEVDEKLNVPASDVNYGDGGKWTLWSDGQGASLELIDPEADTQHPSNWADSDDTGESPWTDIEANVPLGETLGSPINDSLIFLMQGIGECLVDEVELRVNNGPNLVANGGFESGLDGWSLQGSHDFSTVVTTGFTGAKSLHVRAASRGDNQSNRILSAPFASPIPPDAGIVSIRAKVKWLRGHPELLLRLHGGGAEAYGMMALPRRLGTPGMANSRRVANSGPAIYEVKHAPILPAADETVVVTARARDRQVVTSVTLRYRVDPTSAYTEVLMRDNGMDGDAIANDGIFSARIPPQAGGAMVAFYVEGQDALGATGTFPKEVFPQPGFTRCWPSDAVARECVVRWGEVQMPGDFASYHLWVSAANSNRWHNREPMNNADMDGTFIYNNARVIYNALPLFSGSPWHRTNSTAGPAGPNRVDYEMNFPDDDPLLGATDFVLNNPGNPEINVISDLSALAEQTVNKIMEGIGQVHNHRRYIHFFVNGSQRSTTMQRAGNFIFEDSQQPNGDMIEQWFPNDAGGQLFKVEDWFEFAPNGFDITANNDADLTRRTIVLNGQPAFVPAPYRFMFRKRSIGIGNSANDYSLIYSLIDAASPAENPTGPTLDPDLFASVADWEQWMRYFASQRAVGNWDSYGWDRGKNNYLYKPAGSGFAHMTWDIDYSLGLGRPANEPLFASNDPRVAAMFNTPAMVRAYWRAFSDLVSGPFSNESLDPFIDARTAALTANNVNIDLDAVAAIKTYIDERRAYLQSQLATVAAPFAVDGPLSFATTNNLLLIHGTAPVEAKSVTLNGVVYPITWTSATNFTLRVVLGGGVNELTLSGQDRFGNALSNLSQILSVDYTGPVPEPIGALVINEISFAPTTPGAQFVEIVNRSAFNFDLSSWRLDGAGIVFPLGSIVTNGQTLVLAQNRTAFRAAHGSVPVFAAFGAGLTTGQPLVLVRPGGLAGDLIDGVPYETNAPWAGLPPGDSLQLIDATQENSRPANWAAAPPTPGAPNSVVATLAPFDPVWLNELQIVSLVGPTDNAGEAEPWLELHNSGATPLSLNGYFLARDYTSNLMEWPFPADLVLNPGEHRLLWADGETGETSGTNLHTGFRFEASGRLAIVRLISGQPQIVDYLTWNSLGANVSHGSSSDGQSVFRFTLHRPSPRATNNEPALRVFINEWMASNTGGLRDPADNMLDDWFELYNAGSRPVDLSGFYLTDDVGEPTKYRVPTNGQYRINPRGYLLVWADSQPGQNSAARADLHADFKLGASSGSIGLFAPDGTTVIDFIGYTQQTSDVSQGRYSDGSVTRYSMSKPTPRGTNSIIALYNTPPQFPPIARRFVVPGQDLIIPARATDPDAPPQILTHSIVSAPPGSQVNPGGQYRWIVPTNQAPGDYLIVFRAVDDGTPQRSVTTSFIFTVRLPGQTPGTQGPLIHSVASAVGQATFTFDVIPGRTYRVLFKDELGAPMWTQLDRDFVAANATASITDSTAVPHRFYRVQQVD